jgi:hypothetical protein
MYRFPSERLEYDGLKGFLDHDGFMNMAWCSVWMLVCKKVNNDEKYNDF